MTLSPLSDVCEHDWRADPKGFVYLSTSGARRIVCAKCGEHSFQSGSIPAPVSDDPKNWPSAFVEEETT